MWVSILYNETHENINQRLASHFLPDLVLSQIAIPAAITAPTQKKHNHEIHIIAVLILKKPIYANNVVKQRPATNNITLAGTIINVGNIHLILNCL